MSSELTLTPHEHVRIIMATPRRLTVEVHYAGSDKRPPMHLHPDQHETFEVLEGTLHVNAGDTAHRLGAGETLDIPAATPHQMWAPDGPVRARWTTTPPGRTAEWFRALDAANRNGTPGPHVWAALLTEYKDVFQLSAQPAWLVNGALAALAPIGRRRAAAHRSA